MAAFGREGGIQVPVMSIPRSEAPPMRVKVIPRDVRVLRTVYLRQGIVNTQGVARRKA